MAMDVSNNQLTGGVPDWLNSAGSLRELYLDHNQLNGSLPAGLPAYSLQCMAADNNPQLCGAVPSGLPCFSLMNTSFGKDWTGVQCFNVYQVCLGSHGVLLPWEFLMMRCICTEPVRSRTSQ